MRRMAKAILVVLVVVAAFSPVEKHSQFFI
jgi:hypothetical protein